MEESDLKDDVGMPVVCKERSLEVASSLLQVLAHKLRTPLNILVNEISCLPSSADSGLKERLSEAVKTLRSLADSITLPKGMNTHAQSFLLNSALQGISFELPEEDILVNGDKEQFVFALQELVTILSTQAEARKQSFSGLTPVESEKDLLLKVSLKGRPPTAEIGRSFQTLTAWLVDFGGLQSLMPGKIDLVFASFGATFDIVGTTTGTTITLSLKKAL